MHYFIGNRRGNYPTDQNHRLIDVFFYYACMKGFIGHAFYKGANKLILVFYLTLIPNHYNFATKILKKKLTGICIVSFI